MAELDFSLDARGGGNPVDRPSLLLQLRERTGRENLRCGVEKEGRSRADAESALLVPMGRCLHLDYRIPAVGACHLHGCWGDRARGVLPGIGHCLDHWCGNPGDRFSRLRRAVEEHGEERTGWRDRLMRA